MSPADPVSGQAAQWLRQGLELHHAGRIEEAGELYERASQSPAHRAPALHLRGLVAFQSRDFGRAAELLGAAIALDPRNAVLHHDRANAQLELGRFEPAIAGYDRAIELRPDYPEAHYHRGNALLDAGRFEDAAASFETAIALRPGFALAHCNRGIALAAAGGDDAALASFAAALGSDSDCAAAHYNRGVILQKRLDPAAAIADYDAAIASKPGYAEAYVNRAMALLSLGNFAQGFADFEWRWQRGGSPLSALERPFQQPRWCGQPLAGKTILVPAEQGLGDALQFCRYARLLAVRGARVILEVQSPLVRLLASLEGVAEIIPQGDALPGFDYWSPMMSLPLAFGTDLATVPAAVPYVSSPAETQRFWQARLGRPTKLRVGLAWSGGFRPGQPELWAVNERRNIPLAKLAPLKTPGVEFYSLQKGQPAESDLSRALTAGWVGPEIIDHTGLLNDFCDTSGLIDQLDLVICVDTSIAHLAGALGKPVWIMNRFDSCWRWLLDRTDSPWYPTARLYRQERPGDWEDVVRRIAQDLEAVAQASQRSAERQPAG